MSNSRGCTTTTTKQKQSTETVWEDLSRDKLLLVTVHFIPFESIWNYNLDSFLAGDEISDEAVDEIIDSGRFQTFNREASLLAVFVLLLFVFLSLPLKSIY